jgi:hypothetical protein
MITENSIVSELQVSYKPFIKNRLRLKSSNDAYQIIKNLFSEETIQLRGQFMVLYIDTADKVIDAFKNLKIHIKKTELNLLLSKSKEICLK